MSEITWTLKTFNLNDLTDYYKNPRSLTKQQFDQLKKSLDKFGMIDKPIVNADDKNTVIGGHQRLRVLRSENAGKVECWYPSRELDEKEVEELNIRLNKNTGNFDFDILANEFEMPDLLEWGFDGAEFGFNLSEDDDVNTDAEPQIDKASELCEKWGVKLGQLWLLGDHRIICGDCTDKSIVDRLMAGEYAACMWTDPPYGVDYVGKTKDALTIQNDNSFDIDDLLHGSFSRADAILIDGAPFYIAHPAGALCLKFGNAVLATGWLYHETLIWVKNSMVLGHSDYHYMHEPIIYGWKGKNRKWYSDRKQVTVIEVDRPSRSELHPTTKPIELIEICLKNSTQRDDIVYEPFSGSGSTLVACENLKRKCRAIEIDPAYVAVAIQRWVDVTGGKPELVQ